MEHVKQIAISAVADVYGITQSEMSTISRKREHVTARRFVYCLIKQNTNLSLKAIGRTFTNQDHSSVIHSLTQHQNFLDTNKDYVKLWTAVKNRFDLLYNKYADDLKSDNIELMKVKIQASIHTANNIIRQSLTA